MNLNFSNEEVLFIYGHFRKEARKLSEIKSTPNCPIAKENLDTDIALYTSIADKLRDAYPNLSRLDSFKL